MLQAVSRGTLWSGRWCFLSRHNTSSQSDRYTAAGLICVVFTCGLGVWPASFALAAETSSLRVRALTQGIGWFASGLATAIFGIILPYIFNPDSGNLKGKTGFVYTRFCVLGAVIAWLWVPEMKDRTVADIDAMFTARVPARKFRTWPQE